MILIAFLFSKTILFKGFAALPVACRIEKKQQLCGASF